jgi:DNA replication protein DnaC
MLNQQTLDKMYVMKLSGMADAFKLQLGCAEHTRLSFDERLGLLVDAEHMAREQRRLTNRLRVARLRHAASLEDVDFKHPRGLDRQQVLSLGNCDFVEKRYNLIIGGPTGIGKSYLACAFVERACRRGYNAAYVRLPRLLQQLAVARGDGSYTRILERMARFDLLAIDDWLITPLRDSERRDLVEVVEDRSERTSTLIASQLAVKNWHASIGDPNLADSICDRLLHNAHRIDLKGPSMRRSKPEKKTSTTIRRKS